MRRLVEQAGKSEEILVDSAGTSSYHSGDCPDARSIECADRHGLDLRNLRSRPVCGDDFAEFDLILAMDDNNVWNLEQKRPYGDTRYQKAVVKKILEYARYQKAVVKKILEYAPEYGENVPDPYYHNGFDRVFEMIETACGRLLAEITKAQD